MSKEDRVARNATETTYQLCEYLGIAVLASTERRTEWRNEINRRGDNCNQFASQIAEKKAANERGFYEGLELYVCGQEGKSISECKSSDYDWDWDYQPGNNQWVCRGVQTGQYAEVENCRYDTIDDNRWPS